MRQFTAGTNESGQRLDRVIRKYLNNAGSGFIYKMLRKKNITLNGGKADGSEKVEAGDVITFWLSDETIQAFSENDFKKVPYTGIDIVYEDNRIIIVNKAAGVLSQKAGQDDISLNEQLISYMLDRGETSPEKLRSFRPSICNRLDRNTTGLIIFGKDLEALRELTAALKESTVSKYYFSVVKGTLTEPGRLEGWLLKREDHNTVTVSDTEIPGGKYICTEYLPIKSNGRVTLIKVKLLTGRSHQIRAHLSYAGHPVAGDGKYGDTELNKYFRKKYGVRHQVLHSGELVMPELPGTLSYLSGKRFTAPMDSTVRNAVSAEFGDLRWEHGIPEA